MELNHVSIPMDVIADERRRKPRGDGRCLVFRREPDGSWRYMGVRWTVAQIELEQTFGEVATFYDRDIPALPGAICIDIAQREWCLVQLNQRS